VFRHPMRFLFFLPLFPPLVFADQVVLKNGDLITGSVVKKDGAKLTMHSEFLGDVTMPWTAVKSLKSDQPLTVVLPEGRSVEGKIDTAGDNLEVVTVTPPVSTPLATVNALRNAAEQHNYERLLHPSLLELWTGFFDTGLALARGNAKTETITNAFNAARVTRHDKITVSVTELYGKALVNNIVAPTANAIRGAWTYSRDVSPRFFVSTLNTYEHDQFQNLRLRFVAGGGFGVNALKHKKATLSFAGGGDWDRENFTNILHRNSGEIFFGDDFTYQTTANTTIAQDFRIFPNVTDTGQYRMNFDISAVTAIRKWVGFHITASDRYLSDPVLGHLRNDVLVSTGLRLTFAR
jgi:Protein of unknown function, DUF481